jgi:hypothetical protein
MEWVETQDIPPDRLKDIRYGKFVVEMHIHKAEPKQIKLTVGSNLIDYPWDIAMLTSDITTSKLLFNSVLFMLDATFLPLDIKNICTHQWNALSI